MFSGFQHHPIISAATWMERNIILCRDKVIELSENKKLVPVKKMKQNKKQIIITTTATNNMATG